MKKWDGIGISPIAATSACFLGKKPSNRSEVDAIALLHQLLEMVKSQEDLNMGAKKFVDKCITYMKTFVQYASMDNHKVLGFCTTGCINSLGNMWEIIKKLPRASSQQDRGSFTVAMDREHLREFKMRPHGGDFRSVNQSVPADNTWLSATRKRDELSTRPTRTCHLSSRSRRFTGSSTTSHWMLLGSLPMCNDCSMQLWRNG